jgi:predicted nucleotidyltransferase
MRSDPFDQFARDVASDPLKVLQARWRRSTISSALQGLPDVVEVIPSGSLARGTNWGSIRDVDLIVVFDESMHRDWHGSGSAQAALEHMQAVIRERLEFGLDRPLGLVHDTQLRNHVVMCDLDPAMGPLEVILPDSPTFDVMPAFREGSHLRVPERHGDRWVDVDPERLMDMVAARQRAWSNFDEVVRMIKDWADHHDLRMKSLAVEVMVLKYLPKPGLFETLSCSDAVARFFEAASRAHITCLVDPAKYSGEIDPHMNYAKLRKALDKDADLARQAVAAERAWEHRHLAREDLMHPSVFWQQIFGRDRFKRPRVWYWHPLSPAEKPPAAIRHWFDEFAGPAAGPTRIWPPWGEGPSGPHTAGPSEPRGPHTDTPGETAGPKHDRHASLDDVLSSVTQDVPATPSIFG